MGKEDFLIPLNGLAAGRTDFRWTAGKEFFDEFGNTEILDASLSVQVQVEKSGQYIGIDCHIAGSIAVECDRCLGKLVLPVDTVARMSVKSGVVSGSCTEDEDGREIVCIPSSDTEMDLRQTVYDYSCLALPMQKVHSDGECDPEVISRLGVGSVDETSGNTNPFSALKDMLESQDTMK